jgi:hypothetical protein
MNGMKRSLLAACLLTVSPWSHATPTVANISADSDVKTDGDLKYAYYFSFENTRPASVTVNTVSFEQVYFASPYYASSPYSIGTGNMTAIGSTGNVSIAPSDSASAPYASLSGNYQDILSGQFYDFLPSGIATLTLQMNDLTDGQAYLAQFWCNESRGIVSVETRTGKISMGAETASVDYNTTNSDGGLGQWATFSFTASGTSQSFVFEGVSGDYYVPIVNAVQLRAVPEPATLGFVAAGALVIVAASRRRIQDSVTTASSNALIP